MVANRGIRAGGAFVEIFADVSKLARGMRQARAILNRFGASVTALGRKMLRLSVITALPFAGGAKIFADFELQMAEVATLMDDSEVHMASFNAGVRKLATEVGESTRTLARGLFDIVSATIPAADALEVLRVSARLARAGMAETGDTADALTTIINSYGLAASEAADLSDLLFLVQKRGKVTLSGLVTEIGKVASLAATAGISLEEFGASISTLTRAGLQVDVATTAIRAMLITFLNPAKESADAAKKLGFEMNTATLRAEGLAGVFKRLKGLKPEVIANLFPNVRAIIGVLPALVQLEGFNKDVALLANRAGTTDRAFAKVAVTSSVAFAKTREFLTLLLSNVGEALSKTLIGVARSLSAITKATTAWVRTNKEVVVQIAKVVAIAGVVGTALLGMGIIFTALAFAVGALAVALPPLFALLGAMVVVLKAIAGPMSIVIALAFVVGVSFRDIAKVLDGFAAGMKKVFKFFSDKFIEFADIAKESLSSIVGAIENGDMEGATRHLWLALETLWLKGIVVLEEAWVGFTDTIVIALNNAFAATRRMANRTVDYWRETFHTLSNFLEDFFDDVDEAVSVGNVNFHFNVQNAELAKMYDESLLTLEQYGKRLVELEDARDAELKVIFAGRTVERDAIEKTRKKNREIRQGAVTDLFNEIEAERIEANKKRISASKARLVTSEAAKALAESKTDLDDSAQTIAVQSRSSLIGLELSRKLSATEIAAVQRKQAESDVKALVLGDQPQSVRDSLVEQLLVRRARAAAVEETRAAAEERRQLRLNRRLRIAGEIGSDVFGPPSSLADKIAKASKVSTLDSIADAVKKAMGAGGAESRGSFSAVNLLKFASTRKEDRMVNGIEKVARHTESIDERGSLNFA